LDVDYGLLIGIGVSIFSIIVRDQRAQVKTLIPYENSAQFIDTDMLVTGCNEDSVDHSVNYFTIRIIQILVNKLIRANRF
jgi:hypothetical protein